MKSELIRHCSDCEHCIHHPDDQNTCICDIAHEIVVEDDREIRDWCLVQGYKALRAICEILDIE